MRLKVAVYSLVVCSSSLSATLSLAQAHPRPKITGISHLAVYASDMKATDHYYAEVIGAAREPDPENPRYLRTVRGAGYRFEVPR